MMYDDDSSTNSEIIWTFNNVKQDLVDRYHTGKALSDILVTTTGQVWSISFYPNGKEKNSNGKMDLFIQLIENKPNIPSIYSKNTKQSRGIGALTKSYLLRRSVNNLQYNINQHDPLIAKFYFRIENKSRDFVFTSDDMKPKPFNLFEVERDSGFDSKIMDNFGWGDCRITIGITQYNDYCSKIKSNYNDDGLIIIRI